MQKTSASQNRTVYIEDATWADLERLALEADRTVSAEVRRALRLYVLQQKGK